jgi:hypothetical protein
VARSLRWAASRLDPDTVRKWCRGFANRLAADLAERYWAAGRRERSATLDAFCLTTGYSRKYAISVLRGRQRKPRLLASRGASAWPALPGGARCDLGGRLHLRRAPAPLPALPPAALRALRPVLAGGGHQGPPAGCQHLHHRSQPGSAPPAAALAPAQPQAAQPPAGRGAVRVWNWRQEGRPGYCWRRARPWVFGRGCNPINWVAASDVAQFVDPEMCGR